MASVESEIDTIIKNIYSSCDTDGTNQVPASVLIDFIKPYLLQDLSALETLKFGLDPEDKDKLVSSETFYEVMSEWTKKITSTAEETGEFNQLVNQELNEIEEKSLPFIHSTPRASFGQKLLSCENLLHLSNITSPDASISLLTTATDRQALEEEVKHLDYQFNKVIKEMEELKCQLAATEEQNELLQSDVVKYKTTLAKLNEQNQNDKLQNDDLKDEVTTFKSQIVDLTAKLHVYEKQITSKSSLIQNLEKENAKLSDCCNDLRKLEETLRTDIRNLQDELQLKCQEHESIVNINNNMKTELDEQQQMIIELQNTLLEYKKNVAERRLSSKRYSSPFSHRPNLSKCSFISQDYSFEDESIYENQTEDSKRSPQVSLQTELFQIQQSENIHDDKNPCYSNQETTDNSVTSKEELSKDTLVAALEMLETKNEELETNLKNMSDDKIEMQKELIELKKHCDNLNVTLVKKEANMLEYQNSQSPKSLRIQLNKKTKELEESQQSCKEYKGLVHELAVANQNLHDKIESKNVKDDVRVKETSPSNVSELQAANRIFRFQINELENHLQAKAVEIRGLKETLRREIELKNLVWKENKDLNSKNDELNNKLVDFDKINKKIKEEYNNRLSSEVNKNCNLCKQNSERKQDLLNISRKYHEEVIKNFKLTDQIDELEYAIANLRENHTHDKEKFQKEITDQLELLAEYKNKLESIRKSNEEILNELQGEQILKSKLNEELLDCQEKLEKKESRIKELESLNTKLTDDLYKQIKKSEFLTTSQAYSLPINFEKPPPETKSISFEKNKLMIDKLRDKIENLESQLTREKQKNIDLRRVILEKGDFEEKMLQLRTEFDVLYSSTNMEKQSLQKLVDEFSDKLKAQEEYHKQLGRVSNEKIKELSIKLAQLEGTNNNLRIELTNRISLFKNQLEAKTSAINNINECLQNKKSETEQLSKLLQEKDAHITYLHQEINDLQEVKGHLSKNVEQLSLKVFKLESDLSLKKKELADRIQEKNNVIKDLRNSNVDLDMKLSKAFLELIEKTDAYESLTENNRVLQQKLSKTDDNKEKERREYEEYKSKLAEKTGLVAQCCQDLHRGILEVTQKWYVDLKQDEKLTVLCPVEENTSNESENQYSYLSKIVSAVVELLGILATKAPSQMNNSEHYTPQTSPELECLSSSPYKSLKKFTLRPAKLIVGTPVSPDSPSFDIHSHGETCNISIDSKCSENPDSQFGGEENRYREFGYLKKCESQLTSPIHLSFDDAFPHLTDSFLEKIGLHEDSTKQILTKEDTEKTFISFAMQIMLDSKDIKDRLEKQKVLCQDQHRKCVYLIKDISLRLRDHKCIGATDPINPIFVLLEDVRFLLQEVVQSAGQLGIISCENRMMRCWNLVTNYMSILKKESILDSPNRRRQYTDKEMNTVDEDEEIEHTRITHNHHSETNDLDIGGYRCRSFKKAATGFALLLFLCVTVLISVHWYCRMSAEEHQICVLDDFIRKVHIGSAPY